MTKDRYRYFRVEARELLEALGRGVLDLEKAPADRALVARLLRHAHTLKGAARVVQQEHIGRIAHAAEDALGAHRDEGAPPVPRERIDALLRMLDEITVLVSDLERPAEPRPEGAGPAAVDESLQSVRVDVRDLDALLASALEAAVQVSGLRRQMERLEHAGEVSRLLASTLAPRRTEGELTPARARPLAEELGRTIVDAQRSLAPRVDEVEREIAQLRTFADRLRLLPARTLFGALERAARDAARTLGREVTFTAAGGDVRVDANVLSALRAALLHVVRNGVAHGIEPREERVRRGKSPAGSITLEVERRGRKVAFVCRDDGRGIDAAAVRSAAIRKGVPLPGGGEAPLEGDALTDVLLQGGVSTRGSVDAVAGRGVGLDVVREVAAQLKADVRLRTEPGHGTTVEIDVPVSLAALSALHVEVAGAAVAIPLDAVRETAFVSTGSISDTGEGATVLHGGAAIPFAPLATVLGRPLGAQERSFWSAVIVDVGRGAVALGADRLLGTSDVVVRPFPAFMGAESTVAGATLDAEGQPRLVLDPPGLVASARLARSSPERARRVARAPILVIDDSLTTRMLEQSILESAGYDVEVAVSAEAALEKARSRRFGLFVVDVEMPGMDGFEFVRITRADPSLSSIPAILVTSRAGAEDRQRGKEVGASAYIVKSEFDQERLLEHIAELIG